MSKSAYQMVTSYYFGHYQTISTKTFTTNAFQV